ncbi:MAG: hypothetical protein CMJ81_15620 [Planctomycetaceae bacterium]|nr:hypothetical protein [Planctomycetaceae bacterium]
MKLTRVGSLSLLFALTGGCYSQLTAAPGPTHWRAIRTAEHPGVTESFAAQQLQYYLERLSGRRLPVEQATSASLPGTFLVASLEDHPDYRKVLEREGMSLPPGEDAFAVTGDGHRVTILGANSRGALYGVYAFLEENGIRWLDPGPDGEIIPENAKLKTVLSISSAAAFHYRGLYPFCFGNLYDAMFYKHIDDYESLIPLLDWMAKNRMSHVNIQGTHLYEHEGKRDELLAAITKRGFILEQGGHGWAPANIPQQHPELIALINGERKWRNTFFTQLCYSRPRTRELLTQLVLDFVKSNPQTDVLGVWLADTKQSCECELCSASGLSQTDQYVRFVNLLAPQVRKIRPDLKLQFLAYHASLTPPQQILPDQSQDNLTLCFAPIRRCYRHAFNDPACPINAEHNSNLRGWLKKFAARRTYIFDYYYWIFSRDSERKRMMNFPDFETLQQDFKYYHQLGLAGNNDAEPQLIFWPDGLRRHISSRLLWNPDADLTKLVSEYRTLCYGDQKALLDEYFDSVRNHVDIFDDQDHDRQYFHELGPQHSQRIGQSLEQIRKLSAILDRAENSATDPRVRRRIQIVQTYQAFLAHRMKSHWFESQSRFQDAIDSERQLQKIMQENRPLLENLISFVYQITFNSDRVITVNQRRLDKATKEHR